MNPASEVHIPRRASRWETVVWPRWLPVGARMPLVAQVTGAVALTALIVGPWWASAPDAIMPTDGTAAARPAAPLTATPVSAPLATASAAAVASADTPVPLPPAGSTAAVPSRPAHLNLDVRHSFKSVSLSVTVDGKPALNTRLEGSGKRFGMFGKRSERGYTRTLDLAPGAHLVRVRVLSPDDKFDQARVERFDLASASVATMRIAVDKAGLSLVSERPPVAGSVANVPPPSPAVVPAAVAAPIQAAATVVPQVSPAASRQDVNAVADLLQSVRSMLIAIAGFVASAATGFVVQEYLRSRHITFAKADAEEGVTPDRRRRRRPGKARPQPVNRDDDFEDDEVLPEGDREPT